MTCRTPGRLLPVPHFQVVFTALAPVAAIAFQNKAIVSTVLFGAVAQAMPMAKLFRRRSLERLRTTSDAGDLHFFGDLASLADQASLRAYLARMRPIDWVVYAKGAFCDPAQVLDYLGCYTHRVVTAKSRLVGLDDDNNQVAYTEDYRQNRVAKSYEARAGASIRRFLLHALPTASIAFVTSASWPTVHRPAHLALCRSLLVDQTALLERQATANGGAAGESPNSRLAALYVSSQGSLAASIQRAKAQTPAPRSCGLCIMTLRMPACSRIPLMTPAPSRQSLPTTMSRATGQFLAT